MHFTSYFLPYIFRRVAQSKGDKTQAQKTREEQELQVIAQKQKEMMEKLKQNKVSMKKALAGQSYMPCRSAVDNLTRAKEFHFATDDRLGPSSHHANNEGKGKDFVGSLRQHPPSPVSVHSASNAIKMVVIVKKKMVLLVKVSSKVTDSLRLYLYLECNRIECTLFNRARSYKSCDWQIAACNSLLMQECYHVCLY